MNQVWVVVAASYKPKGCILTLMTWSGATGVFLTLYPTDLEGICTDGILPPAQSLQGRCILADSIGPGSSVTFVRWLDSRHLFKP